MESRSFFIACRKSVTKQKLYDFIHILIEYVEPTSFKANHFTDGKPKKYNYNKMVTAFESEMDELNLEDIHFVLRWENGDFSIFCKKNEVPLRIHLLINDDAALKIHSEIEKIIVEEAIIAHELNARDDAIQNQRFIQQLKWLGENPDEYPKCMGSSEEEIDIIRNPGYTFRSKGLLFGSFYRMWYGKEAYKLFDKEILREYPCYENVILDNDVTRITLYESILDYKKKENREKQWGFRKALNLDEIANKLKNEEIEELKQRNDPEINIKEGKFEHGGVRLIQTYIKNGEIAHRSEADSVEERELDEKGKEVYCEIKTL